MVWMGKDKNVWNGIEIKWLGWEKIRMYGI